jgi:hypothetical protein
MSAFPLQGDPNLLISATRAIKNAKYLQERAGILLPGGVVPNFLRECRSRFFESYTWTSTPEI